MLYSALQTVLRWFLQNQWNIFFTINILWMDNSKKVPALQRFPKGPKGLPSFKRSSHQQKHSLRTYFRRVFWPKLSKMLSKSLNLFNRNSIQVNASCMSLFFNCVWKIVDISQRTFHICVLWCPLNSAPSICQVKDFTEI